MGNQKQEIIDSLYTLAQLAPQFEFKVGLVFIRGTKYGASVYVELEQIARNVDLDTAVTIFVDRVLAQ